MLKNYFQCGYTLLELIVVLVIFSLLAGLALPRLTTMYDSLKMAYERDEVIARLGSLGYLAFQQRRGFDLTIYPLETFEPYEIPETFTTELPVDWEIRTKTPIHFFANGVCSGGIVYLYHQGKAFRVELEPPFCEPKLMVIINGLTDN
ncbi:MAG: hypothetical protein DRQ49_05720 [Gammaproteobacteria bacterium]|nr:MAG: hypothetical protein DRQ49_05720 [Gammaproteobacteria bacterium]RKZ44516.1 MAG: hypothetical protein DRQ41_02670 [Gammaproteobacteria bacterium]RKZ74482.1 MAG: hypothetical protein DRQ57_10840 [Gammaproteobacteria bacterium]